MRTVPKGARKRKHPSPPSILTDHALLRFLDRAGIIDVRQFRNMLLTAGLRAACKESGEIDWEKLVEFNSGNKTQKSNQ